MTNHGIKTHREQDGQVSVAATATIQLTVAALARGPLIPLSPLAQSVPESCQPLQEIKADH